MQPGASTAPARSGSAVPRPPCAAGTERGRRKGRGRATGAASLDEDMSPLSHRLLGRPQPSSHAAAGLRGAARNPGDAASRRGPSRGGSRPPRTPAPPPPPPQRLNRPRLPSTALPAAAGIGETLQSQPLSLLFRLASSPACLRWKPRAAAMGLLTILKKMREKERELRLLVLGLDNAGKTTLLKRLSGESVGGTSPTLGFNIRTLQHRGFQLHIWDVGGQSSLRSYWRNYFESTDGLLWVVDSSDRQRLKVCAQELRTLLREERLAGATLLVFANKQDLPGALPAGDIRQALELDSIRSHRWRLQGCSAFTGRDLLPGLDWLLDDLGARLCPPD